jgi:hypothetical protein
MFNTTQSDPSSATDDSFASSAAAAGAENQSEATSDSGFKVPPSGGAASSAGPSTGASSTSTPPPPFSRSRTYYPGASGPAAGGTSSSAGPSAAGASASSARASTAGASAAGGGTSAGGGEREAARESLVLYKYPVLSLDYLLALRPDDRKVLLSEKGAACWYAGSLAFIMGGGGVGKSRWVKGLAFSSILGRDYCGFTTHQVGKWLYLNSEDSEHRTSDDVKNLIEAFALTTEEVARVQQHYYQTAWGRVGHMPPTDLADRVVVASLRRLAAEQKPDVLVVDPWESFVMGCDVNDAAATRRSLDLLQDIFVGATILVIHHSREGAEATRAAFGFNASAFGKGSKTALTKARFVMNVTAKATNLDVAQQAQGLVIACGKSNDSAKFAVRGVDLGEDGVYRLDPNFDVQAYLDAVEGKRGSGTPTVEDVVAAVRAGRTTAEEIQEELSLTAKVSTTLLYQLLKQALAKGRLMKTAGPRGKGMYAVAEAEAEEGNDG